MGKINCPKCGNEISDTVRECSFCGFNKISSYLLQLEKQKAEKYVDYTSFHNEIPINNPQQTYTPKCPICGSANLSKISTVTKATKIGLLGIFGAGDIGKTWKCKNCGSRF